MGPQGLPATRRPLSAHAWRDLASSKITCKDFLDSGKEGIGFVITWLDAYYRDEDDDPIVDFDRIKANGEKLGAYCRANPSTRLTSASDSIYEKK